MTSANQGQYTAFEGSRRIASGNLAEVTVAVKEALIRGGRGFILIVDDETGEHVEVDFRGTTEQVLRRLRERRPEPARPDRESPRGPGRPKLGVVAREVTLLPRHWDWLNGQPGGASVALRKLVEEARKTNRGRDRVRRAKEAAYRFMSDVAGDMSGYEEAIRALFAGNHERFEQEIEPWPTDVRDYARRLAVAAFAET